MPINSMRLITKFSGTMTTAVCIAARVVQGGTLAEKTIMEHEQAVSDSEMVNNYPRLVGNKFCSLSSPYARAHLIYFVHHDSERRSDLLSIMM